MRKILIVAVIILMSQLSAYAGTKGDLKHANPLPNLVTLTMKKASVLQLSETQIKALEDWQRANKPKIMSLVALVVSKEQMLLEESLGDDKDVVKKAETMLDARREIIRLKTLCRATLRNVLSKEQYAQVIGFYKNNLEKKDKKREKDAKKKDKKKEKDAKKKGKKKDEKHEDENDM